MDVSIILAKVFGTYFIIAAVMVLANRKSLLADVQSMFKERFARLLAAMVAILGGLFYVHIYTDYSSLPRIFLSLIGWLILLKGLLYAFLPDMRLATLVRGFSEPLWYVMDGMLALAAGAALLGYGYGFW